MYLKEMKHLVTSAVKEIFDAQFHMEQYQSLLVSIDFPVKKTDFPSIWTDFEPGRDLTKAGVDHIEFSEIEGGEGTQTPVQRWRFAGTAVFTIAALSSLERDQLYDELVRDFSFGPTTTGGQARRFIENNNIIACDVDWDRIKTSNFSSAPGTPWGTDDIIYETTVRMQLQGEFISEMNTGTLYPLNEVKIHPYLEGEPDPLPDGGGWQ